MCENLDLLDDCLCTLRTKALFLSLWSICHGVVISSVCIMNLTDGLDWVALTYLGISIIHLLGGSLMYFSIVQKIRSLFIVALIITYLMPIFLLPAIYVLVIHIIFGLMACRFFYLNMKE